MTGALSAVGLTSTNGFTSTSGNIIFNTNITLPTKYNSSPNTALSSATQLGGFITVTAGSVDGVNSSILSIANITLSVGVCAISYRIEVTAAASSSTTLAFVIALSTTNNALDGNTRISYNCNSPYLALGGINN